MMSQYQYKITLVARCIHCGDELAEPATFSWDLLLPSAHWMAARSCSCELARATDLPHVGFCAAVVLEDHR
jgi:hypothetical protein